MVSFIRESAQKMALASDSPVQRLHATLVSRLLVMHASVSPLAHATQYISQMYHHLNATPRITSNFAALRHFATSSIQSSRA